MDLIHLNGMTYTNSLPRKPHNLPGPGIIIELIHPLDGLKSMSMTQPRGDLLLVENFYLGEYVGAIRMRFL